MKKIIAVILVLCLAFALAACGKSFYCDFCGAEKSGKKHTTDMLGEELIICNDCYKGLKELAG